MNLTHPWMRRVGASSLLAAFLLLHPPAVRAAEDLQLPRLGNLGRLPDPELTVVVDVDRQGDITIDGVGPLSLDALQATLARRTAKVFHRQPDGTSNRILLVNADARLPWSVAQWVMQAAAHPKVQIYKIFFGARLLDTDRKGAIGWTLPRDRSIVRSGLAPSEVPIVSIKMFAREEGPASDARGVFPRARAALAKADGGPVLFEIKTPPPYGGNVPVGYVLQVLDALQQAGATRVTFEGTALPPTVGDRASAIREHVRAAAEVAAMPFINIGEERLPEADADLALPEPRGLVDALVGFGGAPYAEWPGGPPEEIREDGLVFEIEEEEILEEPVIRDAPIRDHPAEDDGGKPK